MSSELLHLNFNVTGPLLEAALECEEAVFLEAFGNTADQLKEEYGPYAEQSMFVTVSDDSGYVVGECRLVRWGDAGLKTLNDIQGEPWNVDSVRSLRAVGLSREKCHDIATMGVRREYRRSHRGEALLVSAALFHGVCQAGYMNGLPGLVAIIDSKFRRGMAMIGLEYIDLPGTWATEYLGSPESSPVYLDLDYSVPYVRREYPETYRLLFLGNGLTGISIPAANEFILPALKATTEL